MSSDNNNDYKIQWKRVFERLSLYNIKKGFRYISHYGLKGFFNKLNELFTPEEIPYETWYPYHFANSETLEKQKKKKFNKNPLISIVVPAYETPETFFKEMVNSVKKQTYDNWELCILDAGKNDYLKNIVNEFNDARIKYCFQGENKGIAGNSNEALKMADGEYIGLLDHDDTIEPDALFEVVSMINSHENVDMIYTDEDKLDGRENKYFQPALKPDFNIDLLRSNNYICHFIVVKSQIINKIGGFNKDYDGAQDYDLIFRIVENSKDIVHIPKILYHWRVHQDSTAENPASKLYAFEAGARAIKAHLDRMNIMGQVSNTSNLGFYRVKYKLQSEDKVSVIIPNKDNIEVLDKCLRSVFRTKYSNFEVIIVENNSTDKNTFDYYDKMRENSRIRILEWKDKFNYSAINNYAVANTDSKYLLFLNNDIEFISNDWMEELLSHCQREEVGAVGAKLYYPDDTIQHAGTIVGIGGIAGHAFVGMPRNQSGYFHKASIQLDLSAVTAACMMVKREVFEKTGGFEESLEVAFNDVDLCLKINKENYLVVYNPYVEAYHYESKSRGAEDTKEKVMRFQNEIEYMRTKWTDILKNGDPYYNKNLSLDKWNYSLRNNH